MSDEFPRPYAEQPPAAEPVSGLRLLHARPGAVAATVVLAVVLAVSYNLAWLHLFPSYGPVPELSPDYGLDDRLIRHVLLPLAGQLPLLAPLIVIAALAGRRVTAGRALGLWAAATLLSIAESTVIEALFSAVYGSAADDWIQVAVTAIGIAGLVLVGVVARRLLPLPGYPAFQGGRDTVVLVVASVVMSLAVLPKVVWVNLWTGTVLWALLGVAWSIAVLVTSFRRVPEWAGIPAEQGRQDP